MLTKNEKIILENHLYNIAKKSLNEWEEKKNKGYSHTKNIVLKWLNNDTTKHSQLAYTLFGVPETANEEDKGAARSLFSKKVRNAKNDNGSTYEFTKLEINKLWSMMNKK